VNPKTNARAIETATVEPLPSPAAAPITSPAISPIAHPVRQWRVADNAMESSPPPALPVLPECPACPACPA